MFDKFDIMLVEMGKDTMHRFQAWVIFIVNLPKPLPKIIIFILPLIDLMSHMVVTEKM